MVCWHPSESRLPQISLLFDHTFETALLDLAGFLCIHGYNLDLIGVYVLLVLELEVDVLDNECPDVVAESIRVQTALLFQVLVPLQQHQDWNNVP